MPEIEKNQIDFYERESSDFEEVIERYNFENRFIAMVESGNTEDALKAVSMITVCRDRKNCRFPEWKAVWGMRLHCGQYCEKQRSGERTSGCCGCDRTFLWQKMYAARNPKELWKNILPMTRDFTEAVRKSK